MIFIPCDDVGGKVRLAVQLWVLQLKATLCSERSLGSSAELDTGLTVDIVLPSLNPKFPVVVVVGGGVELMQQTE